MRNDKMYSPSADEVAALASLEAKCQNIRDAVTGIARGYQRGKGMYLYGAGGAGKSYTVTEHLKRLDVPYQTFNSRMTAKGLFLALEAAPDAIFLLEDMERITKDADAQGVLRSALWSQPGEDRIVTWTTATANLRFAFRGGILMIANTPLAALPELKALGTRIRVVKFDGTDSEFCAKMRYMASQGHDDEYGTLTASECLEIAAFVIDQCYQAGYPVELRIYDNAKCDYLQARAGDSVNTWQTLVANRVRQSVAHQIEDAEVQSREDRLERDRDIVREIIAATGHLTGQTQTREREKRFYERTGGSRPTFYRRWAEVRAEDKAKKAMKERDNDDT
jgi:hypothetical protein